MGYANCELVARDLYGVTYEINIGNYPDTMPIVRWTGDVTSPARLLARPKTLASFVETMFLVDAWRERGQPTPELILPNVPGARQDRRNLTGDYLFTAKSIAEMINARQFRSVHVLDPHSDVITALIDRCRVIDPLKFTEYLALRSLTDEPYAAVIAPDGGAEKRAWRMATAFKLPLLHGWKHRDVGTGVIDGFGVEPLERGRHYLVVDDLCDGGGTFVGLAQRIHEFGATADLLVTHGLFTQGTRDLLAQYRRVFATDSVASEKAGVTYLPVCFPYFLR